MAKKNKRKKIRGPKIARKKLPPMLSAGTAVPALAGYAMGAGLTGVPALGFLCALAAGVAYWFLIANVPQPKKSEIVEMKTPDDIVMGTLYQYRFVSAAEADPLRPEAVSLDGTRWSHKLIFETEAGETDVYVLRGSLETGEGTLEYIEGESTHQPDYWLESSSSVSPE